MVLQTLKFLAKLLRNVAQTEAVVWRSAIFIPCWTLFNVSCCAQKISLPLVAKEILNIKREVYEITEENEGVHCANF